MKWDLNKREVLDKAICDKTIKIASNAKKNCHWWECALIFYKRLVRNRNEEKIPVLKQ